ncbi:MAG: phosphatidate cytidylyltransferase [Dehalococcoidia bacterium]
MLWQRLISALVLLPVVGAAVWFGEPWFSIVVAVFVLLGILEFYRIAAIAGWRPFLFLGTILTLLFILAAHSDDERTIPLLITVVVVLPLIRCLLYPTKRNALMNWTWTVGGVFYLGWMMSHFIFLRELDEGRDWVYLALLATFACDTGAYFIGRAVGKTRMAPMVSPGKTWEGAVGGLVCAVVATVVVAMVTELDDIGYHHIIPLGFLIGVFAQLGDLSESAMKRSAEIKEAGGAIMGHGGALDRLDSLIFVVVLVYYWVIWLV